VCRHRPLVNASYVVVLLSIVASPFVHLVAAAVVPFDLDLAHYPVVSLVQLFFRAPISSGNRSHLVRVWTQLVLQAWLSIVLAHHSLDWLIVLGIGGTGLLYRGLMIDWNFLLTLIGTELGSLSITIARCHMHRRTFIVFDNRSKIRESLLPCNVVTFTPEDRVEQIRLRLKSIFSKIKRSMHTSWCQSLWY
jgi:hypothetical protein